MKGTCFVFTKLITSMGKPQSLCTTQERIQRVTREAVSCFAAACFDRHSFHSKNRCLSHWPKKKMPMTGSPKLVREWLWMSRDSFQWSFLGNVLFFKTVTCDVSSPV